MRKTLHCTISVPHRDAPPWPVSFSSHGMPPPRGHHKEVSRAQDRLHGMRPHVLDKRWVLFHQLGFVVAIAEKRKSRCVPHVRDGDSASRFLLCRLRCRLTVRRHVSAAGRRCQPDPLRAEDLCEAIEIRILFLISGFPHGISTAHPYRVRWADDAA